MTAKREERPYVAQFFLGATGRSLGPPAARDAIFFCCQRQLAGRERPYVRTAFDPKLAFVADRLGQVHAGQLSGVIQTSVSDPKTAARHVRFRAGQLVWVGSVNPRSDLTAYQGLRRSR